MTIQPFTLAVRYPPDLTARVDRTEWVARTTETVDRDGSLQGSGFEAEAAEGGEGGPREEARVVEDVGQVVE